MSYRLSGYLFALGLCLVLIFALVQLLRRRRIKEQYAALWIVVALGVAIIGAIPAIPIWLARVVGVEVPANLLFAVALVVLLLVCIQLSIGVSALEEKTRTLAEELALLRLDVERGRQDGAGGQHTDTEDG